MKTIHIILLILIAGLIAVLISFSGNLTTYDTIATAREKQGKYVNMITILDTSKPIEYDPIKNPNYLVFYVSDTTGATTKVVYHNTKPADLEKSNQIVLKGSMQDGYFQCKEILLKCPSKYKDDKEKLRESFSRHSVAS